MTTPTPLERSLSERLRRAYFYMNDNGLPLEAADALDAKDARIKELEGALRDTLECLDGCMVFITSREKINSEYGPGWIADMTKRAREALK